MKVKHLAYMTIMWPLKTVQMLIRKLTVMAFIKGCEKLAKREKKDLCVIRTIKDELKIVTADIALKNGEKILHVSFNGI